MKKIDANVILRYILNDHVELSFQAKEIIDTHIVEVPIEVLCEVVYVLTGYYNIDRKTVSKELENFFEKTRCILPSREAVLQGLEYYKNTSLDLVDCILAGYAETEHDDIFTFDKKLQRLIQNKQN
jgi:predicted nucleic-acid-binding protein